MFKDYDNYLSVSLKVYLILLVFTFILKIVGLDYFGIDVNDRVVLIIDNFISKYGLINVYYFITLYIYTIFIIGLVFKRDDKDFIISYLDDRYERIYNLPRTVGETAGKYADNILLITMNGHITCAKYGVIYDSFDCRNRTTEFCWKVK